jgi:hypothetical protein
MSAVVFRRVVLLWAGPGAMADWRNHLAAKSARPMLSAATATAAVLVITSRLRVQRVDGDQTLCAAGGLGQWVIFSTFPSMTASPAEARTIAD